MNDDDRLRRLLDAQELADYYSVCRASIYNLMAQGLPSVKIGRARRFRVPDTDAWLEAQQSEQVAS